MAVDVQSLPLPISSFARHARDAKQHFSGSPKEVAQQWLSRFEDVLNNHPSKLSETLHPDCWWRDLLALSWDFRTIHSLDNVASYLQANLTRSGLYNLQLRQSGKFQPGLANPAEGIQWVESMFDFETNELKGAPEMIGQNRPYGAERSHQDAKPMSNWQEVRQKQLDFVESEPAVVIVGAGHSGLNLAARLQQLGVSTLVVDKEERIGDNWRKRYQSLVTHDPVHFTHMAYVPFPSTWPLFTPKDKLGDWLESYASILELNVWTKTPIHHAEYHDQTRSWTVDVTRAGTLRRLHPRHLVFCTGHSGEPKIPTFLGQADFQGLIYHGSQHVDASTVPDVRGKKVVVVGTGNSGHDIAQNFCENGAQVTMLQRRPTYVISTKMGVLMLYKGMYDEGGPPTEDADIYSQSMPIPVQFAFNVGLTQRIMEVEKDLHEGLAKAGFGVDIGEDKSGIFRKYITRGGGYYLDVGCSSLIIDGKVKVKRCPTGIANFVPDGLLLGDGSELKADIVVLATGFDNMRSSVRKIVGDKIADRCKDVWDLDEEGEVNAMWRSSGHPSFWFFGGNLALCRTYSKLLALQIKGIEDGLWQQ